MRRSGEATLASVIGRLYGERVRRVAAVLVVSAEVVWFALLTEATETVVTAMTPWDPTLVLVGTALVFVAYTALGGQRAVVRTDLLQLALMAASLLGVALPLAVASLARTGVPARLLRFPVGPGFSWLDVLGLLVLVGLPHAVGSDVWAKLLSARDEASARRGTLGASGVKLAFGLACAVVALAGVAAGVGGPPSALLPATVRELAGPAVAPFLLVGLVATMQSSSDSVLLSAASATTHDLLRLRSPGAVRLFVGLYGVLGLLVALALRDLVETFRLGYTLFASALILPTLAGFATGWKVRPRFAAAAMLLGGGVALAQRFLGLGGLDPVLAGTAVNAAVLAAGTRRARPATPGR